MKEKEIGLLEQLLFMQMLKEQAIKVGAENKTVIMSIEYMEAVIKTLAILILNEKGEEDEQHIPTTTSKFS